VDVLSRGYGRQSQLAARVNPEGTAEDFGDEPLLIARETGVPVYVAPQRFDAGLLAEAEQSLGKKGTELAGQGFNPDTKSANSVGTSQAAEKNPPVSGHDFTGVPVDRSSSMGWEFSRAVNAAESTGALAPEVYIHLLDDGFQHRQLARSLDILLLNRQDWQDGLLPAGNLREPLRAAHRAGVIAIPANDSELEAELRAWGWQGPVWRLRRTMEIPTVSGPVAAFCGIARPEQFFAGLEAAGLEVALRTAFPDHHRYTARDLDHLVAAARAAGATALLTTKKDLVRLGKLASAFPTSISLTTARLRIEIEEQAEAIDWLIDRLGPGSTHSSL
jgi:tetraacyldisaccharide-1-P 4'-kinase